MDHLEINCTTGRARQRPLTKAEQRERVVLTAETEAEQAGRDAALTTIRERAKEDPAFAALAKLLGVPDGA